MIEIKRPRLAAKMAPAVPAPMMLATPKASPAKGWSKGAKVSAPKAPAPASALHSRGHFEAQAKAHLAGAVDSHDAFSKL